MKPFGQKFFLTIFIIFQAFSVLMISTGIWPGNLAYLNLALQLAAVLFFDLEYAVYSAVLSLPFYIAVPNPKYDSLSDWRFVFILLFIVFWFKTRIGKQKWNWAGVRNLQFAKWDFAGLFYLGAIVLSIFFEPFKTVGIKQVIFLLNAYLLYVVVINVFKSRIQLMRLIGIGAVSLGIFVAIGYLQYIITFFTPTYYFWQYWAVMISKTYYGLTLANTLTYSNSWFTFVPGQPTVLRMFSVLPDSHAFAVLAMLAIPYAAVLARFAQKRWQKISLWIFIGLSALAIILSGTRGVWAGIVLPVILLIIIYAKKIGRPLAKSMVIPLILFFVFLLISPLSQKLINLAQNSSANTGDFLKRAESIYDLNETSNSARIAIWKQTLLYAGRHPLLGSGYANFLVSLNSGTSQNQSYQSLAAKNVKTYNLPEKYITAHNFYLQILAETGIIGLICFAWYFIRIAKAFWQFLKKYASQSGDSLVFFTVYIGVYIAWLFAYLFVDVTILNDRVLIYFFLSLAITGAIMNIKRNENA